MGSGKHVDHDECVGRMRSLAHAEELDRREKKEYVQPVEEKKCTNCNESFKCKKFQGKMSFEGTYSVGGDETTICDKWKPRQNKQKTAQNIKSLMKQFKKSMK